MGGYVAFPDDQGDDDEMGPLSDGGDREEGTKRREEPRFDPDDPDLLQNRSIPERALVISAGVIANVVFAYAILLLQARGMDGRMVLELDYSL